MATEQIALPILGWKTAKPCENHDDLVGRKFTDGHATMTVMYVCHFKPDHVMVQRDVDGKSWSVPAWLVRRVTGRRKRRAA